MRLIIKFEKQEKIKIKQNQLQGFVYRLIKKAGFEDIHDSAQNLPRFFNFSQLFLGKDNFLTLIISSPRENLIKNLKHSVKKGEIIRLGDIFLPVKEIKIFTLNLVSNELV